VSSHLLNEIQMIANRILIIDKGEKVVEGTASELLDPAHTIVEVETLNNNQTTLLINQSEWSNALHTSKNDAVVLRINRTDIPALNNFLVNNNVGVISIQPRNTLEDYFLSITKDRHHVEPLAN
jgi:ABC-type multidrug transport system ATPase subunit